MGERAKTLSYGRLGPFGCISSVSFTVSLLLSVSFTTQLFLSGFTTLPPPLSLILFSMVSHHFARHKIPNLFLISSKLFSCSLRNIDYAV